MRGASGVMAIAAVALMLMACFDFFRDSRYRSDLPAILVITGLAGSMLAGSMEILLIVLFFYLLTVGSLLLVGITKAERLSNEAALKFFIYGTAATAIMVYGPTEPSRWIFQQAPRAVGQEHGPDAIGK